ncbi:uncharacterized protein [Mytilus edulis]|uniref:uncharacterized protein n=1 Tax=Mytilus edulis TaxID=6550 RepID=UPI0039EE8C5A
MNDKVYIIEGDNTKSVTSELISSKSPEDKDLKAMVFDLTVSMNSFCDKMTTRIDNIETSITKKISDMINKKVDTAIRKLKNEVQKDINKISEKVDDNIITLKDNLKGEIEILRKKVTTATNTITQLPKKTAEMQNRTDTRLNAIIRNLPETRGENIISKVNGLIKDGLILKDVKIKSAERKISRRDNVPGIVLIAFHSSDDKRKAMEEKRKLKDSRNFKNIFIEHDLPKSQRMMNSNLRNIVRTIGKHQLELRGSRVQVKTAENIRKQSDYSNGSQRHHERQYENRSERDNYNRESDEYFQRRPRGNYQNRGYNRNGKY